MSLIAQNIVRVNGNLLLIDLDVSIKIDGNESNDVTNRIIRSGEDYMKTSTNFMPPELIPKVRLFNRNYLRKQANTIQYSGIRDRMDQGMSVSESSHPLSSKIESFLAASSSHLTQLVPMHSSQDMWSLGATIYQVLVHTTLFLGDNLDNIVQYDDLKCLEIWSDTTKNMKLDLIDDNYAKNLLSLLLHKDPSKRLTIDKVLLHPFLSGTKPSRLEGDPAEFDVFISYRVNSELQIAELLYNALIKCGLRVFWDKKSLKNGELWREGFCKGLIRSSIFVPLFSKDAMNHPTMRTNNWEQLKSDSNCDNVLLEHRLAIEMKSRGLLDKIFPIFIGPQIPNVNNSSDNNLIIRKKFVFGSGADGDMPMSPNIIVDKVEKYFCEHLDTQQLGIPMTKPMTVSEIADYMVGYQGYKIEGNQDIAVEAIVVAIVDMIRQGSLVSKQKALDKSMRKLPFTLEDITDMLLEVNVPLNVIEEVKRQYLCIESISMDEINNMFHILGEFLVWVSDLLLQPNVNQNILSTPLSPPPPPQSTINNDSLGSIVDSCGDAHNAGKVPFGGNTDYDSSSNHDSNHDSDVDGDRIPSPNTVSNSSHYRLIKSDDEGDEKDDHDPIFDMGDIYSQPRDIEEVKVYKS